MSTSEARGDKKRLTSKRTRVLDEAARTLNRRGVSQTSLVEIAGKLNISRAALYYYFDDHQDLVFQCYRRSCEQMMRCLNEASQNHSDPLEVIDSFVERLLAPDEAELASLSDVAFLRMEQRSIILGLYKGLMASLAKILDDGAHKGLLRPCASSIVAPAIMGLISWIPTARHWQITERVSDQDIVEAIKTVLHNGIAENRNEPVGYVPFNLASPDLPAGSIFNQKAMAAMRREALLAAASWLFNLKGVDATSLDEVAQRVGVTKKVIYHNMGSKEQVVAEAYRRAFRFYENLADRMGTYEGPRIDAICAFSHALAEASLREDISPLVPLTGQESWPEAVRDELRGAARRMHDFHMTVYEQGRSEGSVRNVITNALLIMHPGLFEWLPKWLDVLTPEERAMAPRELTRLYRTGLRPLPQG